MYLDIDICHDPERYVFIPTLMLYFIDDDFEMENGSKQHWRGNILSISFLSWSLDFDFCQPSEVTT